MGLKQDYCPDFERFWREYPRKVNKGAAYRAFKNLKLSPEDVDELVMHIDKRKREDKKWIEGKFIPYPASFLNGHRWEDDYERVKPHWSKQRPEPQPEPESEPCPYEVGQQALQESLRIIRGGRHVH